MAHFDSMSEFRAAVNSLVASSGKGRKAVRNKKVARRNSGAPPTFVTRRNMGFKVTDPATGQVHEADTFEEFQQLQAWAAGRAPAGLPAFAPSAPVRQRKPRKRREYTGELRDPGAPITFSQAKIIGGSVGGMRGLCPAAVTPKGQRGPSFKDVLTNAGMTKGSASAAIDAMEAAGVLRPHRGIPFDASKAAHALQILAQVGGITCPVPYGSSAAANPWGRW